MNLRQIWTGLLSASGFALDIALRRRSHLFGYLSDCKRSYLAHSCEPPIERTELSTLTPRDLNTLFLPIQCIRSGSTPFYDLVALTVLSRCKRPECIFEIGTFEGLSAVVFAGNVPDCTIFTLDLPPDESDRVVRTGRSWIAQSIRESYETGYLVDQFGLSDRVRRLHGDSALFDFSPYFDRIDLFYVDGAHTADYVDNDTRIAFQCIKSDGMIIWHDCLNTAVFRVIKRIARCVPVKYIVGTSLAFAIGKPG